jgi:Putative Flp pilus-assembly TadE/G-like
MMFHSRAILRTGINRIRTMAGMDPLDEEASLVKQSGQIVVIFALMLTMLIGLVGIAIDTTYAWRESLRVQRASDAAALAGAVYMPGNFNITTPNASTTAIAEAAKNGFSTGVTPSRANNPRELDVRVTTQVPTFFSRIFGINFFTVTRSSKAVFVQPVPMGSPENYYGTFGPFKVNGSPVALKGPDANGNPLGATLTARGFWGSTVTQGAGTSSGDAYMPKFNGAGPPPSGTNPNGHDSVNYTNYAVYMPPGSSGGNVWIFDPVFCATKNQGTGEFWLSGTGAVYTRYELYNTNNQPYSLGSQTYLGSSGNLFSGMSYHDSHEGVTAGGSECVASPTTNQNDPRYWHNKWWNLTAAAGGAISGGATGQTYRIHVTTDPGNTSQDSVNALNNYAIYASATGGLPQVYGIGSMQMYTPLASGANATFYLAQIDQASGAGKTVEIDLWDPGDTNGLTATMSVLAPCAGTNCWAPVTNMNWTATRVTSDASCTTGQHGGPVSGIVTNNGSSLFNGCWLAIQIVIPPTYTAPQNGWWKISYAMGTGPNQATDETTWQVSIRGNPVHLI